MYTLLATDTNSSGDGMADQNNTEASFAQYDIEFGGEGISTDQRKMNAVRAVSTSALLHNSVCMFNL
jgi:hypothetical protein